MKRSYPNDLTDSPGRARAHDHTAVPGTAVIKAVSKINSLILEARTIFSLYDRNPCTLMPKIKLLFHLASGSRIFFSTSQAKLESIDI